MTNAIFKKSLFLLFGLFMPIFILLQSFVYIGYMDKKEQYISHEVQSVNRHYNVTYKTFKNNATHFYNSIANNKKVIEILKDANSGIKSKREKARKKLDKIFKTKYQLIAKLGIDIIQFHLSNNESFYRRYQPDDFGDDLTPFRYGVAVVNENKKPINGLETGKYEHAFRFVYPIFDETKKHIGRLEGSVSSSAFIEYMERALHQHIHFIIKDDFLSDTPQQEKLLSKYTQCKGLKNFLHLKRDVDKNFKYSDEEIQNIASKLKNYNKQSKEPFGIVIEKDNTEAIIIFIPVEGLKDKKTVAFFVIYGYENNLASLKDEYIFNCLAALILSIIFTALLFNVLRSKSKLKTEVKNKTKELEHLNKNLQAKVNEEVTKNREKDKQMLQQSRLAQMGEMISMIAHQWRQPLSTISSASMALSLKAKLDMADNDLILETTDKVSKSSQHLSRTIDDFRDFFKSNKERREASLEEIVEGVLNIVQVSIENKNIKIITEFNCNEKFSTCPNEIKQVVLNLIKNAEDILLEKEVKEPYIKISTFKQDNKYIMEVSDNGGGVPEDIIENIFDPYFSTKTKKDGTGLGLYMSKTIVEEHCHGELSVSNSKNGAIFRVTLETNHA